MNNTVFSADSLRGAEVLDAPTRETRKAIIAERADRLWDMQKPDGHIVFELEADCTIPAEYVLLRHFLGEIDREREARIARYLRKVQNPDGSWPLFHDGAGNISATVKGYWALKLTGEDIDAPHMARARSWLLGQGGAAKANVFTRIMMALFRQIPWRGMPCIPVEAILMPEWFPFHMSKIAYWSRTVLTPLLILYAKRAKAANPTGLDIRDDARLGQVPFRQEKGGLGVGLAQKDGLGIAALQLVQVPRPEDGRAGGIGIGGFVAEDECGHGSVLTAADDLRAL